MIFQQVIDRLGIMFPILVAEIATLITIWFLYRFVTRKDAGNQLILAKAFLSFWGAYQYVAFGFVFSVGALIFSFFEKGERASFLRYESVIPFIVLGWL
jgi:hypothetical protein